MAREQSHDSEFENTYPEPRMRAHLSGSPQCDVLVMQHFWECGSSIMCFSTESLLQFDIFKCPLPWHSLCLPELPEMEFVCKAAVDPFEFVRRPGSWPGKVLYCFSEQPDDEVLFEPFTDVWCYSPFDPIPLVPRPQSRDPPPSTVASANPWLPALTRGLPLWSLQRFWDVSIPYHFWWQASRHEYVITTADDSMTPRSKLDELAVLTHGRRPIQEVFPRPAPRELSEFENLRYFEADDMYELS